MKKTGGIIGYFIVLLALYQWQLGKLFQPLPIVSVVLGTLILSVSQWRRNVDIKTLLEIVKTNVLFSGGFTTLLSLLAVIDKGAQALAEAFLPMIYGALVYALIWTLMTKEPERSSSKETLPIHWNTTEFIHPILVTQGLTPRECHVALKVIQGASNKEIADQLYISEGTVKKHIQSIYKRWQVEDRNSFLMKFWEMAKH